MLKQVTIALMLLVLMASAMAGDVNIANTSITPTDANYLNVTGTIVAIVWDANSGANRGDINFLINYHTSGGASTNIVDANAGTVCARDGNASLAVTKGCSYNWTLPAGLDGNYTIDINAYAINLLVTVDKNTMTSATGAFQADTNACTTVQTFGAEDGDSIVLTTTCSGTGATATTYYGTNRQERCPSNYSQYDDPFQLTFGSFNVCYYSVDSVGNTETTQGFVHDADSNALSLALLTELALAALILFLVLGGVVLRKEELNGPMMIAMVVGAVIVLLAIVIFAAIL